jgi:hypothetical protein
MGGTLISVFLLSPRATLDSPFQSVYFAVAYCHLYTAKFISSVRWSIMMTAYVFVAMVGGAAASAVWDTIYWGYRGSCRGVA